jgi:hypothetical protein
MNAHAASLTDMSDLSEEHSTPWGTGLTVAAFVAAVTAAAIVVLGMGMTRVHPLVSVALNLVAVGGLAPTLWEWRKRPVRRWFVLGAAVGVAAGWAGMLTMVL